MTAPYFHNGSQATGHHGTNFSVMPNATDPLRGRDVMIEIPAVGAGGVSVPRKPFLQ